ncbi:MAG: DegV family protein [Anaerolineales bacterium]
MSRVAIVTDSTASLPQEMYGRYHISVVPYYLQIGGQSYRDGMDISPTEINTHMEQLSIENDVPTTSNPGPGDYVRAYREASEWAEAVVSLHMTSEGSGAYQSAIIGCRMMQERDPDLCIRVIDTRNVSMAHGWMALQAARSAATGASLEEVVGLVERMIPHTRMIQTADTLRYLYMGGRIGRARHLLGSMLNIKPLISMEDGLITTLGVVRSRGQAYRRIASLLARAVDEGSEVRVALTHAAARGEAEKLCEAIKEHVVTVEVLYCDLSPALTVHSGPGTVGVCYVPEAVLSPD